MKNDSNLPLSQPPAAMPDARANKVSLTRQRLLDQGLLRVRERGLRGLVVRELTSAAQVNLGSFVYHFGTRERFLQEVVEHWYAPLYDQLREVADLEQSQNPLVSLEKLLLRLIDLMDQHASMVAHILADAVAGEPAAQSFLLKLPERHPKLILELLQKAREAGTVVDQPPLHLMAFIMSAVAIPMALAGGPLRACDWLPPAAEQARNLMASPESARQRLGWALAGIAPVLPRT